MSAGITSVSDAANLLFADVARELGVDTALVVDLMKRHQATFVPMVKSALAVDDKHAEKPSAQAKAKLRPGHRPGFDHEPDGTLLERGEPSPERRRHPERFAPPVNWELSERVFVGRDRRNQPKARPPVPTTLRELSERQRRLAYDLMNMPSLTGGVKLSEAAAIERVLAAEKRQALQLSEKPANDRKLEDETVKKLMQGRAFADEASARAAYQRMRSRFRR